MVKVAVAGATTGPGVTILNAVFGDGRQLRYGVRWKT